MRVRLTGIQQFYDRSRFRRTCPDGFLVVANQCPGDPAEAVGIETDAVADREFQHGQVRPHLLTKSQALDNAAVEVDEFGFGELVDINAHGGLAGWVLASTGMNSVPVIGLQQAALLVFFAADTRVLRTALI